jgi:hypothetical protein
MDGNAALLLQFMLTTETIPFYVQAETTFFFLETSLIQHKFRLVFSRVRKTAKSKYLALS